MARIDGVQVSIDKEVTTDDVKSILMAKINWKSKIGVWCTVSTVCDAVGIDQTHKNRISVGRAISEIYPSVKYRRTGAKKLMLIPSELID